MRATIAKNTSDPNIGLDVKSYADYYPFETDFRRFSEQPMKTKVPVSYMKMPGKFGGGSYRYSYQGKFAEKDNETGLLSFEARQYDPRIGRWISVDPAKQFHSPYIGMGNNPIKYIDKDGKIAHIFVGAAIGATISAVSILSTGGIDALMSGKGLAKVALGAVTGGAIAATGGVLGGAVISGASNYFDQSIIDGKGINVDPVQVGVATITGGYGQKAGKFISPKVHDIVTKKIFRSGWAKTGSTLGGAIERYSLKWWARSNTTTAVMTNLMTDPFVAAGNSFIADWLNTCDNPAFILPEVVVTANK